MLPSEKTKNVETGTKSTTTCKRALTSTAQSRNFRKNSNKTRVHELAKSKAQKR